MAVNVTDIREWAARRIAPRKIVVAGANPVEAEESFSDTSGGTTASFVEEDIGWVATDQNSVTNYTDLSPVDRIRVVKRARIYFNRDAMARQAVRLHTSYAIGRGMSIKYRGEGGGKPPAPTPQKKKSP